MSYSVTLTTIFFHFEVLANFGIMKIFLQTVLTKSQSEEVMTPFSPLNPYNELPKLPPDFNFDDIQILKRVNTANIALSKLSGIAQSIPNRKLLLEPLTVREAVASSGIENINTTVEEVFQASFFDESRLTKEQKETLHYKDALLLGYELIERDGFLNTNGFINIHSVLEPNKKGLRRIPGVKIANLTSGQTLYTPPEGEVLIRDLLKNLEVYYNDLDDSNVDALIKIAVSHYQFESIHPFLDGNGRVGRILMVLQLILAKRLQTPILYLSGFINNNREEYYRLLRGVTSNDNWKDWVLYVLKGIEIQSLSTTTTVIKIKDLMMSYKEQIKYLLPKVYSADLIEFLFTHPFYSQKLMSEELGFSRNTSFKYLNQLSENGFLKIIKVKKENFFFSPTFLDLLK